MLSPLIELLDDEGSDRQEGDSGASEATPGPDPIEEEPTLAEATRLNVHTQLHPAGSRLVASAS